MAEPNCLPMCSCCTRPPPHSKPFRRCGGCKVRTYCERKCQVLDWKLCNHKSFCKKSGDEHVNSNTHQPWCAYLDRDPEIEDTCKVSTGKVKTNPQELITSGLNTCIFVVIKTRTQMIGWHASATCPLRPAQTLFRSVRKEDFVSGFIVPGEDRIGGTLNLKPTCRTMRLFPRNDPTYSRTRIFDVLQEFDWFNDLEILAPVNSYKDFVVFDMAHKRPFADSNTQLFDEGCSFDGNVGSVDQMACIGRNY